jgi:hypothetical protein
MHADHTAAACPRHAEQPLSSDAQSIVSSHVGLLHTVVTRDLNSSVSPLLPRSNVPDLYRSSMNWFEQDLALGFYANLLRLSS